MSAARYNLVIEQNATFVLPMAFFSDAAQLVPLNLTGHLFRLRIKKSYDNASTLYSAASVDATHLILNGAGGTATLTIPKATTAAFPAPWFGVWDLVDEDAGGIVLRRLEGRAEIRPGVAV